jgi:CDK-activating kinase assembly factor MAT1
LINGVDVAETEAKIKRFQIENQELIAQNAVHEARQAELSKRQEDAMKKEREERKAELLRLEEEARREEEEIKRATIRSLVRLHCVVLQVKRNGISDAIQFFFF